VSRLLAALLAGAAALCVTAAPARADGAGAGMPVQISQDTTTARARVGAPFSFTTTVRNTGERSLPGIVAHLDVVSLDPDVYVDPEDWSTQRTQYLPPLPGHGSARLSWSVQAVNDGRFLVYVALATAAGDRIVAGPVLHAEVRAQQRLDAPGLLPIAIGVPVVVLLLLIATRYRRRRLL
jgi:hypothetical protein